MLKYHSKFVHKNFFRSTVFLTTWQKLWKFPFSSSFFRHISQQTEIPTKNFVFEVNFELRKLKEQKNWPKLFDTFRQNRTKIIPDESTYALVIDCLSKLENVEDIKQLISEADKQGIVLNQVTLTPFLLLLGKIGKLDDMVYYFNRLKHLHKNGFQPLDQVTYNIIIHSFGKAENFKKMYEYIEEAKQYFNTNILDNCIYTSIFNALGRVGKFEELNDLIQHLNANGVVLDVFMYNCMINAFLRFNKEAELQKCLQQMKQQNVLLDNVTYNSIINFYAKTGKFDKVEALMDEMKQSSILVNTETFNSILYFLGEQNNLEALNQWLYKMKVQNIPFNTVTYNTVIGVLAKREKYDEIEKILRLMKSKDLVLDNVTYNGIISIFGKAGMLYEMNKYIQEMKANNVTFSQVTYTIIIDSFGRHGKLSDILNYIRELEKENIIFTTTVYNCIINRLVYFKAWGQFWKYLNEAKSKKLVDIVTFSSIIQAYGFMERSDLLEKVTEEMQQFGLSHNTHTYHAMIRALTRCRKLREARQIFYEMDSKQIPWTIRGAGTFTAALRKEEIPDNLESHWAKLIKNFQGGHNNTNPLTPTQKSDFEYFLRNLFLK